MSELFQYLSACHTVRQSGASTDELSYHRAIMDLLEAVGATLDPAVRCVGETSDEGAGRPDVGLFTADQIDRSAAPRFDGPGAVVPARGVVEVKAPPADLDAVQQSDQLAKYVDRYGVVLLTNLRAFRLLEAGPNGPTPQETFELASSADAFNALAASDVDASTEERFVAFLTRALTHTAPLTDPADVAARLASYATDARLRLEGAPLNDLDMLREALEEALGVEFRGRRGEGFFRSTVVQTLFYGLFSAWVLWHREDPTREDDFDWHRAADYLRMPVLERLFMQMVAPSQLRRLRLLELMNWTADALNRVDRASFFATFEEDRAVQYFYEPFLERFDPDLRDELGVWYTPPEVVRYMVRRVDTVLQEELGIADGLASDDVLVLDPCCGTGAYLVEVLRLIGERLKAQGGGSLVAESLRTAVTERIFGFEILTAPYVVAHLQIGLFLAEMGAPLLDDRDDRAAVYLTNALTGWNPDESKGAHRTFPEFKAERLAAERVKQDTPILVVLGNPPYSGFPGMAVGEERELSEAYRETKRAPAPQGQGLNDLYVRFFRMAERQIVESTEKGVVCYISNYSWLDGLSHPGMRERYLDAFDNIWIDNLNGDKYRTGKTTPDGDPDPSVFSTEYNRVGIQVGTAVATLCRTDDHNGVARVNYREFWGTSKRADLEATADLSDADGYDAVEPPVELGYPFTRSATTRSYLEWPKLPGLFPTTFPGIQSGRSDLVVDVDRDALIGRMEKYFDVEVAHEEMEALEPRALKSTRRFNAVQVREQLQKRGFLRENIVRYLYRPFDVRWLYWEPETKLLDEKRADYVSNVTGENNWITAAKSHRKGFDPPLTSTIRTSRHVIERGSNLFPMYLNPDGGGADLFSQPSAGEDESAPVPNLSERAKRYLRAVNDADTSDADPVDVETLFYHTVAVLHAPRYRQENEGALRQDWPRVPLPESAPALRESAEVGREVASLVDVEDDVPGVTAGTIRDELAPLGVPEPVSDDRDQLTRDDFAVTAGWGYLGHHGATMPGGGTYETRERTPDEEAAVPAGGIERWGGAVLDVYLNDGARWRNVPERVWDYTLGGYPVVKKWLSYRERDVLGRDLTLDEVRHVTHMVRRIAALLLLEPRLDANLENVESGAADGLE